MGTEGSTLHDTTLVIHFKLDPKLKFSTPPSDRAVQKSHTQTQELLCEQTKQKETKSTKQQTYRNSTKIPSKMIKVTIPLTTLL